MEITSPVFSDWLSIIVAILAFAALLWRMEQRIGQILDLALKHFESLSRDHETAMEAAARRHRQVLDRMDAEKDRHHDDHERILIQMERLVGKCERILDRMEQK